MAERSCGFDSHPGHLKVGFMKCIDCNGQGGNEWSEYDGFVWRKCITCKGRGNLRISIMERTMSVKYADVIQPVRDLAIENSGLKNTLRSVARKYGKARHKRNKLAGQVEKQGKYIEELKLVIKSQRDIIVHFLTPLS